MADKTRVTPYSGLFRTLYQTGSSNKCVHTICMDRQIQPWRDSSLTNCLLTSPLASAEAAPFPLVAAVLLPSAEETAILGGGVGGEITEDEESLM